MPGHDPEEQREYYARRMSEELARAEAAADDGMRHLHYSWANHYRRRLDGLPGSSAPPKHPAGARDRGQD